MENSITLNSFEKKLEKSKKIIEKLSDSKISLSMAMKQYKEGLKELKEASEMLESAELEFKELSTKE